MPALPAVPGQVATLTIRAQVATRSVVHSCHGTLLSTRRKPRLAYCWHISSHRRPKSCLARRYQRDAGSNALELAQAVAELRSVITRFVGAGFGARCQCALPDLFFLAELSTAHGPVTKDSNRLYLSQAKSAPNDLHCSSIRLSLPASMEATG